MSHITSAPFPRHDFHGLEGIPCVNKDDVESYARSWKPPQHISVTHKNFFELPVYSSDGEPLSVKQLQIRLKRL